MKRSTVRSNKKGRSNEFRAAERNRNGAERMERKGLNVPIFCAFLFVVPGAASGGLNLSPPTGGERFKTIPRRRAAFGEAGKC